MNTTTRLILIALLSMPLLAACDKSDKSEETAVVVKAPLTAPTTNDDNEWGSYLSQMVTSNMVRSPTALIFITCLAATVKALRVLMSG